MDIPMSFCVRKGLNIKSQIDRQVLHLWEDGTIDALMKKWFSRPKELQELADARAVDYPDILIPSVILCVGVLCSILTLVMEIFFHI